MPHSTNLDELKAKIKRLKFMRLNRCELRAQEIKPSAEQVQTALAVLHSNASESLRAAAEKTLQAALA